MINPVFSTASYDATTLSFSFNVTGGPASYTHLSFSGYDGSGGTTVNAAHSFALNTWYAVRAVRSGNLIYLFVGGTLLNPGGTAFSRKARQQLYCSRPCQRAADLAAVREGRRISVAVRKARMEGRKI